jgi:hypothetical protein
MGFAAARLNPSYGRLSRTPRVDRHHRAGDVLRAVAQQERHRAGDVVDLGQAA